jgi:hypothetical protein
MLGESRKICSTWSMLESADLPAFWDVSLLVGMMTPVVGSVRFEKNALLCRSVRIWSMQKRAVGFPQATPRSGRRVGSSLFPALAYKTNSSLTTGTVRDQLAFNTGAIQPKQATKQSTTNEKATNSASIFGLVSQLSNRSSVGRQVK